VYANDIELDDFFADVKKVRVKGIVFFKIPN
jgi:hypothetical protein